MLKIDNFTFKGDQIELLTYKSDSKPDSESKIEFIPLADFKQWCLNQFGYADNTFMIDCDEYGTFKEWWGRQKSSYQYFLLETYINRPTLPIVGITDYDEKISY